MVNSFVLKCCKYDFASAVSGCVSCDLPVCAACRIMLYMFMAEAKVQCRSLVNHVQNQREISGLYRPHLSCGQW